MYVILVYDIHLDDKGKKVLPKVFKTCKKYLSHIQNSVFEGELKESQLKELRYEIKKLVREDLDSVILFSSNNKKWMDKDYWGKQEDKTSFFL